MKGNFSSKLISFVDTSSAESASWYRHRCIPDIADVAAAAGAATAAEGRSGADEAATLVVAGLARVHGPSRLRRGQLRHRR